MEDLYIIFFYLVGVSVATVYQMPKELECCHCQDVQKVVKNLTKYDADYLDHDTSLKCIMQHPGFPQYVWMCECYI